MLSEPSFNKIYEGIDYLIENMSEKDLIKERVRNDYI